MSEVDNNPEIEEVDMGETGEIATLVPGDDVDAASTSIGDFIDAIQAKKYTDAENQFKDLVGDRLQDALDQARVKIASQIYNDQEVEEPAEVEEPVEVELEDEEETVEN